MNLNAQILIRLGDILNKMESISSRIADIEQRLSASDSEYVSINEASKILGRTPAALRKAVSRGDLLSEKDNKGHHRFNRGYLNELITRP